MNGSVPASRNSRASRISTACNVADADTVSWRGALAHWLKQRLARMRAERAIRRGAAELMALDDHMLADIGLTRSEVAGAARHGHRHHRRAA